MEGLGVFAIAVFTGFFAINNPVGNVPVFLGLTIPAFKITGGILVFFVGFEMIRAQTSSIDNQTEVNFNEGVSISPLGIPILAGPGTIVTAMNFTTNATYLQLGIILLMFAVVMLLNHLAFISSEWVVRLVGANKIVVVEKIMGLIIAIIGVNMLIQGIHIAFFE